MKTLPSLLALLAVALAPFSTAQVNLTNDEVSILTCASVRCMSGTECVLQQVQCIRAPCPAVPTCVAKTTSSATQSSDACTPGFCPDGESCELKQVQCFAAPCNPVPTCVPQKVTASCSKKCGRSQRCYRFQNKSHCADMCSPSRCNKNEKCELQTVQCLVAPCPRVAVCKQA